MVKSSLKAEEKKIESDKMKMKASKTRNELKASDSNTYRLKIEERTKNGGKSSRNSSRKRLESVTEAPQLGFTSRKYIFSPKTAEMHSQGVQDQFTQPPSPIYSQNEEEVVT